MSDRQTEERLDAGVFDPIAPNSLIKAAIRHSLSGMLIFQDERIVFSNPALQKIVGLTESEIRWTNPFDLIHPKDREQAQRKAAELLNGRSPPYVSEFRVLTVDGNSRWVHMLATSIIYQDKPAVLANFLDIEERKQAEKLQHERLRLQKTLIDSLPHPAMLIRRDRIILAANRLALNLGARIGGFCHSAFDVQAYKPRSDDAIDAMANAATDIVTAKCKFCQADKALQSGKSLSTKTMEAFGGLWDLFWVPVDGDTYLHYAIDVTEQRAIELTIRSSEERYRLITDTMNDGLSIQNPDGIITQVNRRFCEMTGFTRAELIGRPMADLFVNRKDSAPIGAVTQANGLQQESEAFIRHKDGRKIEVSLKIESLMDEQGRRKGDFAFFSDITELKMLRRHTLTPDEFENIVGHESSMHKLFADIIEIAVWDFPVLIQGESGVGKELVAQAIHNRSRRKDRMFVPVNCAALSEGLLESELFGHIKGAFTGAIRDKKGRFELAHSGTIFLDEIGELSIAMQVKLLRILEEGRFERVGDHRTTKVDVRVISATNKNLESEMRAGRFRQDLFYRLCVMPILVPPLRERKKDIPLLVDHFMSAIANQASGYEPSISQQALNLLMIYDWPGNVRELKNAIYSAAVKSKGAIIQPMHLPSTINSQAAKVSGKRIRRRKLDQDMIRAALARTGGNKLRAARLLGVDRSTLYRFLSAIQRQDG